MSANLHGERVNRHVAANRLTASTTTRDVDIASAANGGRPTAKESTSCVRERVVATRQEHPAIAERNEPQLYCDAWQIDGPTKLLSSSPSRGWLDLSAELWAQGSMAAGLVHRYVSTRTAESGTSHASGELDRRRLFRVLDYIQANLEGDLTLDRMASIACLSRFHFARAFRQAVGESPHRYVSTNRLDRAKLLLLQGDRSLDDIALALSFSSQANFTRAFTKATGQAPGGYRREGGTRQNFRRH